MYWTFPIPEKNVDSPFAEAVLNKKTVSLAVVDSMS